MRDTSTITLSHLLYLHGFRSSPQSAKAQLTKSWFAQHYPEVIVEAPQLPPSPADAAQLMQSIINNWPQGSLAVMGSSLGGYYASWVSAQCHCPAVFLNPAVNPARDLAQYIGNVTAWHDPNEAFYFRPEYVDQLKALECSHITHLAPQMLLIAKGDEVLDWQEMSARYPKATQIILEGGDHALGDDFSHYLPRLGHFLHQMGHE